MVRSIPSGWSLPYRYASDQHKRIFQERERAFFAHISLFAFPTISELGTSYRTKDCSSREVQDTTGFVSSAV